jgi:antitoxin MazE
MKASIVPIGNSRGIRIPKAVLEQCRMEKEVEMEVQDGKIILMPAKGVPREGWDDAFASMNRRGEDRLLIPDKMELDSGEWEW